MNARTHTQTKPIYLECLEMPVGTLLHRYQEPSEIAFSLAAERHAIEVNRIHGDGTTTGSKVD